jgi:hypothetical protein
MPLTISEMQIAEARLRDFTEHVKHFVNVSLLGEQRPSLLSASKTRGSRLISKGCLAISLS